MIVTNMSQNTATDLELTTRFVVGNTYIQLMTNETARMILQDTHAHTHSFAAPSAAHQYINSAYTATGNYAYIKCTRTTTFNHQWKSLDTVLNFLLHISMHSMILLWHFCLSVCSIVVLCLNACTDLPPGSGIIPVFRATPLLQNSKGESAQHGH